VIEPVISGAGRPASAKASATTGFRCRSSHCVDRRRVGGDRLQHDGLGDIGRPVAVHVARDLQLRVFGQAPCRRPAALHHDRVAGNAFDDRMLAPSGCALPMAVIMS
jgi:hypothetical protein